jgi:UDP-N-acetylmuramate--alanine ligase
MVTFHNFKRIHLVGIGGIGMSGIAEVLLNLGFEVSGSDLRATAVTERLASLGGRIFQGHNAGQVAGADVVVVSSAVLPDNPEVAQARGLQVPVIPRAEMLGELMRLKYALAVAGSHGKTTATSMIAVVLHHAGLDPTVVIGGRLNIFGSNARLGQGDYLVAEADESDGSFLKLFPSLAVITNIDAEHMSHFQTMENLDRAFVEFANRVPFYGAAVLCLDDPRVRNILPAVERRQITYGFDPAADVRAGEPVPDGEGSRFEVYARGQALGPFRLHVPGRYNVQNALAAVAAGLDLGLPPDVIREGLALFRGVDRRFQTKGVCRGVRVVDDYAHHPTEIRATLAAARSVTRGRVIALFQPHRYTRVRDLWREFAAAFAGADVLFCTPIYPAGEAPLPGVTSEALLADIRLHGPREARYAADFPELARQVAGLAAPGDLVITFGAGNIYQAGELLLQLLAEGEPT